MLLINETWTDEFEKYVFNSFYIYNNKNTN